MGARARARSTRQRQGIGIVVGQLPARPPLVPTNLPNRLTASAAAAHPQQAGGGGGGEGTPHGSPVRSRALLGSMVSPMPPSGPPHSQPSTLQQLLLAMHPMQGQGQGQGQGSTMSPLRALCLPSTVPTSPSVKSMDGECDRIVLPPPLPPSLPPLPPLPPPPQQQQQPTLVPGMPQPTPNTLPPTHAHAPHWLPLPLNPTMPLPTQGQGTGPSQPPLLFTGRASNSLSSRGQPIPSHYPFVFRHPAQGGSMSSAGLPPFAFSRATVGIASEH